jgi:hypothetical protein
MPKIHGDTISPVMGDSVYAHGAGLDKKDPYMTADVVEVLGREPDGWKVRLKDDEDDHEGVVVVKTKDGKSWCEEIT